MARLLKYFLIGYIALFAIVLPMSNINQVFAQTTNDADGDGVDDGVDDFIDADGDGIPSFDSVGTYYGDPDADDTDPCVPDSNNTPCQQAQGVNPNGVTQLNGQAIDQQTLPFSCGTIGGGTLLGCVAVFLYYVIALPTAWIARATAELFDYFVAFTINSGTYSNFQGFIYVGWQLLRDLCNIFFIFVLVYLGLRQIFGKGGDTRQIFKIIVAALLINFSLFFGKVVVDAGNILGRAFYSSIKTSNDSNDAVQSATGNVSISALLMSSANPQELLLSSKFESDLTQTANQDLGELATGEDTVKDGQYIVILLMLAFFNVAMIKIFISLCLILVARTVGIWFLLVLSPLAFLTMVLPSGMSPKGLASYSFSSWLNKLLNLSMMVAVFMFFIYLAALFFSASSSSIAFVIPGESFLASFLRIIIPFALIMFILNMANKRAGEMSGEYGGLVKEGFGKLAGVAMAGAGLAFGGAASLTRVATGARSRVLKKKAAAAEAAGDKERAARLRRRSKYYARATGDLRNVKIGGQSIIGKASQYANQYVLKEATGVNLDLGKGGTETYESAAKARNEKLKKRAEDEKAGDDDAIVPYGHVLKRDENGNIKYDKNGDPEIEYRKLKPGEKEKMSNEEKKILEDRVEKLKQDRDLYRGSLTEAENENEFRFTAESQHKKELDEANADADLNTYRGEAKRVGDLIDGLEKRKSEYEAKMVDAVTAGRTEEVNALRDAIRDIDVNLTEANTQKADVLSLKDRRESELDLASKKTRYENSKVEADIARTKIDSYKKEIEKADSSINKISDGVKNIGKKPDFKSKKQVENELLKAKDSAETKMREVTGVELKEDSEGSGIFVIKTEVTEKDWAGLGRAQKDNEEKRKKWNDRIREINQIKEDERSDEEIGERAQLVKNIQVAKKVDDNIEKYKKQIKKEYKPESDRKSQADAHIKATNKTRLMDYAKNGLWDVHSSLGDLRRGNVDLFPNAEGKERARLDVENQALNIDDKEK